MSTPSPLTEHVSARMSRTHGRDTQPERALRSAVHRRGLRFRVDRRPVEKLRRRADLVFVGARVAVFLDGCFWHACPQHLNWPKNNAAWWRQKLEANRRRDRETDAALRAAGWEVVRVWEHEDAEAAADRVEMIVRARLNT